MSDILENNLTNSFNKSVVISSTPQQTNDAVEVQLNSNSIDVQSASDSLDTQLSNNSIDSDSDTELSEEESLQSLTSLLFVNNAIDLDDYIIGNYLVLNYSICPKVNNIPFDKLYMRPGTIIANYKGIQYVSNGAGINNDCTKFSMYRKHGTTDWMIF